MQQAKRVYSSTRLLRLMISIHEQLELVTESAMQDDVVACLGKVNSLHL